MNRLSKEKRDRLIIVVVATVAVVFGLWYLVLNNQKRALAENRKKLEELQKKIGNAQALAKKAADYQQELENGQERLAKVEASMLPPGSEFITLFNTIKAAALTSKVEFNGDLAQQTVGETDLLPKFPYKSATFPDTLFFGYYHEFGKFLADLENNYPYIRFNLTSIRKEDVPNLAEPEKLRFAVTIVALQQPSAQK